MSLTSLWPADIRPSIPSPRRILTAQAKALGERTRGVLIGELKAEATADQMIRLDFDIVVPSLNGFRYRILSVAYRKDLPYPAVIDAEIYRPTSLEYLQRFLETGAADYDYSFKTNNDRAFATVVERVFGSAPVLTIAQSLIARANEALDDESGDESAGPSTEDVAESADESR